MGKFANSPREMHAAAIHAWEADGCEGPRPEFTSMEGLRLSPLPKSPVGFGAWHGKSEFEALGLPVPFFRRSNGIKHLRDMGFTDREQMDSIVGKMSAAIERDDSHEALEVAMRLGVDATGCYRMLSVLLTGEPPAEVQGDAQ